MKKITIYNYQFGFTVIEILVSILIMSIIILATFKTFTDMSANSHDLNIREVAHDNTESLLTSIGSELRMIGNGIPFDQANFRISSILEDNSQLEVLQDSSNNYPSYPILIDTATNDYIEFRLNETGNIYFLTANFDPTSTLTISLNTTVGLFSGDSIYLSNSLRQQDDGMMATIDSVNSATNEVTIDSEYYRSIGAIFEKGCSLEPVALISLKNQGNKIIRNSGFGDIVLANNSNFTLNYLDKAGNILTLPLTANDLLSNLGSVELIVTTTSTKIQKILSTPGSVHTLTKSHIFGLRSFNF